MSNQVRQTTPSVKLYQPISTVEDLARHLQWALSVELSTIPPYLCALYSIRDRTSEAARLVRDVVIEEMLHMALVNNLMNAIGARPSLTPEYVPLYPGYIPHHAVGGPFIQLQPLTADLARVVFMAIEQPEPSPKAPPEGDAFKTIGQFYKAIEEGFKRCHDADPKLFERDTGFQRTDTYLGGGGGELVRVCDIGSATRALIEITEQGEGAPLTHPPYPGEQPFGGYDTYGKRTDGTYGPIIGTPWEMSHYGKFKQLATGEVNVPATYPMEPNPRAETMRPPVRQLAELFDACYTHMLDALERAFTTADTDGAFFGEAFPVMQFVLPKLATVLMQTTLEAGADPALGPNAGPGFVYRSRARAEIVSDSKSLLGQAPDADPDYSAAWDAALHATVEAIDTGAASLVPSYAVDKPGP